MLLLLVTGRKRAYQCIQFASTNTHGVLYLLRGNAILHNALNTQHEVGYTYKEACIEHTHHQHTINTSAPSSYIIRITVRSGAGNPAVGWVSQRVPSVLSAKLQDGSSSIPSRITSSCAGNAISFGRGKLSGGTGPRPISCSWAPASVAGTRAVMQAAQMMMARGSPESRNTEGKKE